MIDTLIKRYLWLIDTLKNRGEMSFDEIADRWGRSSLNDMGSELSQRTFYNHCRAIERQFGIEIACRRGRGLNLYRITNPEVIEENLITKWVLDSFATGEMLMYNSAIADKILLEEVPSGRTWLDVFLRALHENREVAITYENFSGTKYTGNIRPLCVKLFKRRWYVLALRPDGSKRIFSLDRMKDAVVTDEAFEYPADFVPTEYFQDVFGIIAVVERDVQNIVIRAYTELPGYLRSLPMHHSHTEIATTPEYIDFSLRLVPTFDFIQELLLHREQLEVVSPKSLRDEISAIIKKMNSHYDN